MLFPTPSRATLAEQLCDDLWRGLERCVDLRGIFAAGLGDFGLASAGAADKLGDCAHELARLDAFREPVCDACLLYTSRCV